MSKAQTIPHQLVTLASWRGGLIKSSELRAAKVSTDRIATLTQHGKLCPVTRGLFSNDDAVTRSLERHGPHQHQRLVDAYAGVLSAGPTAAAAGQSALVILGAEGLPARVRSEITLHSGGPTKRDSTFHNFRERYDRYYITNDARVVFPEVALSQAISGLPRNNAIAAIDSMLNQRILNPTSFTLAQALTAGRPGSAKTHSWWGLANGTSDSPAETFARLTCTDRQVPPDAVQLEVQNARGQRLARVDLGWRLPDSRWLLVEVDGFEFHSSIEQVRRDRIRQNNLVTKHTLLQRWSGADAASGVLAAEVHKLLMFHNWKPGLVPQGASALFRLPD